MRDQHPEREQLRANKGHFALLGVPVLPGFHRFTEPVAFAVHIEDVAPAGMGGNPSFWHTSVAYRIASGSPSRTAYS
jgi:hypothetical protein